ncbi:hypothetical protein [Micromonospora yangpuensis]|uniref:Uncharacterized protein n=1 Tax=Micromonospora yangpuensis TaxID=683228 RepID=A0A1C6VGL8_9ACTN|nr:hypothetical protein [Micromonospora yangpuensis]SCL65452.1 hypothetical protein GA0070617_5770 [Micromonospora yangpuensis]
MAIRAGDVLHLTRAASVQFVKPIMFRLIRVREDLVTYHGWVWLEGYELDQVGDATRRREVLVRWDGLRLIGPRLEPDGVPGPRRAGSSAPTVRTKR